MKDTLSRDTTYIGAVTLPPGANDSIRRQDLTIALLSVDCGETVIVQFDVTLDVDLGPFQSLTNTAVLECPGLPQLFGFGTLVNEPPAPCGIDVWKDVDNRTPVPGQTLTYTITVENNETVQKNGSVLQDDFAALLDASTFQWIGAPPASWNLDPISGLLTVDQWTLDPDGTEVFTYSIEVSSTAPRNGARSS